MKITTSKTLINNLSHLMILYDYDSAKVAKKSGLTKRAVQYYLNGERVPSIEKAEQLASAFGLEGWHLIMPNLPNDISQTKHLRCLVENYLSSSLAGRDVIEMVAEREAKYAK